MKKYTCVFAALAAFCFAFTNTARAEKVIGGYYGPSTVELTGAGTLRGSLDENGSEFGMFFQKKWDTLGLHFGLGTNSTEIDGVVTSQGRLLGNFKVEAGTAYDLLGVRFIEGESINGMLMLGLSALGMDASGVYQGDSGAVGWKLAGGFEIPFANDEWVAQILYERADLGEIEVSNSNDKFEVEQSGFRLRVGARF